jgi:tetratricopeptide (TPR) repeat protein
MSVGPTNAQRAIAEAMAAAMRAWQAGRLGEAEAILRRLLQQAPQQAEAAHLLGVVLHQAGRTADGIEAIKRALKINPNAAPFHINIAKLYRAVGDTRHAIEHGRRAVSLKADRADAFVDLGLALLDAGDAHEALLQIDTALKLQPALAEGANARGSALRGLGRLEEAEAAYRRALQLKPHFPEALNNLGTVHRQLGRAMEAEAAFREALKLRPNYVLAANNLILALKDLGRLDDALSIGQAALRMAPQNADAHAYIGAVYLDAGDVDRAMASLTQALTINPNKAETHNTRGRALVELARMDDAVHAFRRAIELKRDFGDPHNNLGNALRDLGRFDEALLEYETALKLDPQSAGIYGNLVEVKKFTSPDDAHLRTIEHLAMGNAPLPRDTQARLQFALGKAYDDLKRYDDAFDAFAKGAALHRQSISYDEAAQLGFFKRIEHVFTRELIAAKTGAGSSSALPIFVVGMPRSGTTLLEQIIAGHSRVKGAGETRELDAAVMNVCNNNVSYPEIVRRLAPQELTQIGDDYWRRLSVRAPDAAHVVDKLPTNFHFLGLIHLALPNAKVLHLKRNALDTCVSCFSKMFAAPLNHTYDLGELGRYWRAYDALMAHWRRVLPEGSFLDVDYERLTRDLEGETRRIFAFCGLDFEPQALAFDRKEGAVRTASSYQVRQPITSASVERWRHYERHLGPLMRALGLQC